MTEPEQDPDRPTIAPFLGALAVITIVVIGIVLFNVYGSDTTTPGDQVAKAAVGQNDALQRQDYSAFRTFTCRADVTTEADFLARQRDSVAKNGERYLDDVTNIRIDGDRATATVTYHFDKTSETKTPAEVGFAQEDGDWKVCLS
ncbi:lumazine-binding protein [Mycolicibacterium sp.]|uniref:Rv0361 family membrane protein n=1 Tax=Mycolicibacterium sp. TaxID=2320850 RepID=UPI001A34C5C7|nr:lumazine-binding protein [Mycolicibacterium sp.]MBJ7339964.1 lumazine-binding protein [Mycolicibacterium sp.]